MTDMFMRCLTWRSGDNAEQRILFHAFRTANSGDDLSTSWGILGFSIDCEEINCLPLLFTGKAFHFVFHAAPRSPIPKNPTVGISLLLIDYHESRVKSPKTLCIHPGLHQHLC